MYCKALNVKGLRKESSKKPKSKLVFLTYPQDNGIRVREKNYFKKSFPKLLLI